MLFASLLASSSSAHSGSDAGQEDTRADDAYAVIPGEIQRLSSCAMACAEGNLVHVLSIR